MKKKFVKILNNDKIVCDRCEVASNVFTRFMGLMFRKGLNEGCGLILEPCNEIHTFNMRFSIDVITLDKDNTVLAVFDAVPPWRVKPSVKNGRKVIELNPGVASQLGIKCGDALSILELE